jgi:hypothetical protein
MPVVGGSEPTARRHRGPGRIPGEAFGRRRNDAMDVHAGGYLTDEERGLLDRMPPDASTAECATALAALRDPNPIVAKAMRLFLRMSLEERFSLVPYLERELAARGLRADGPNAME